MPTRRRAFLAPRRGASRFLTVLPRSVVEELRTIVGREAVIDSANDLRIFERDGSIEGALPDAVVLASNTEQVAGVIKVAAHNNIPVVPRGAGTGLSGGAVTIRGGIALQVTRMRRILNIDPVAQTAIVEPGVVNQELSLVAAQHGLFYAPDPSSQKACTIGGNAAENSGGPHCLYYGVTTNHVLGMEVVLADGSVHWVSGDAPDRVGLDLCGILVGSEGTLCAITRIKVRLLRTPPSIATLLAAFPSIETASQAVSGVIGGGIVPAALEMMDQVTVGAVEAHYRAGYPTDAGAVLLVEVDGIPESTRELIMAIRDVLAKNQGYAMREAQTPAERDLLWQGRKGRARQDQAELLPARRGGAAVAAATGSVSGRRDRRALPAARRQRFSRGRRQPTPQHPVRHARQRSAAPGRGRWRGDAARRGRARRRALGRARHRAGEKRFHALDLQPRRPRRHASREGHARP